MDEVAGQGDDEGTVGRGKKNMSAQNVEAGGITARFGKWKWKNVEKGGITGIFDGLFFRKREFIGVFYRIDGINRMGVGCTAVNQGQPARQAEPQALTPER